MLLFPVDLLGCEDATDVINMKKYQMIYHLGVVIAIMQNQWLNMRHATLCSGETQYS